MNTTSQQIVHRPLTMSALAALVIFGGIYSTRHLGATPQPITAEPAVPVTVRTLAAHKIRLWSEFSGRLHAVDSAEIRPEVGGRITAVLFEDGQTVKAGDLLFLIDPRPYEAAVARAQANLASARTNAAFARIELDRAAGLIRARAIAQRVYDDRANASRVADAAVKAAQAELTQAELDLEHAHVRAPISGRASRAEITVGNLVAPGAGAPLLTTIVAHQSIYADFEVDEQTYMATIRGNASGREAERRIPVELSVPGDGKGLYRGTIYSFDNRIDGSSGTIRARAKFDNADGALIPGMFVTVRLASSSEPQELLVPDRAVEVDQNKTFVYVVDKGNRVAYREVALGNQVNTQRIALEGLHPGDRVVLDGLQHVKPATLVEAREAP